MTALGIAASGVVGFYTTNSSDQQHGFLYSGGTTTRLDYPAALLTQAYGLENNFVVGNYLDTTLFRFHGFVHDGSAFTPLNVPGASETYAYAISSGRIVGSYKTNNVVHGFVASPANNGVQLRFMRSSTNLILRWTNTVSDYALQSSSNLSPAGVWINLVTNPPVVKGEYSFTNPATSPGQFFRLIK